jgi:hypothetical protein
MQALWNKHSSLELPGIYRIMIEKEVCLCSWYYSMGFYLLVTSSPESSMNIKRAVYAFSTSYIAVLSGSSTSNFVIVKHALTGRKGRCMQKDIINILCVCVCVCVYIYTRARMHMYNYTYTNWFDKITNLLQSHFM